MCMTPTADTRTCLEGAKLELNRGGCPIYGFAASSLIYKVEIWWLVLSFRFDVGARAPPGVYLAPPLDQGVVDFTPFWYLAILIVMTS